MHLGDIPRRNAYRYPAAVALQTEAATVTWPELNAGINRVARSLTGLGLRKGDRIALLGASSIPIVQAYFAAAKLGLVIVPLPSGLVDNEVAFMVNDVGAKALVVDVEPAQRLGDAVAALAGLEVRIAIGEHAGYRPYAELLEQPAAEPDVAVGDDDLFAIRFTSGTTGSPKGIPSTHRDWLVRVRNFIAHIPHSHRDRVILASPISLGLGSSLLMSYSYVGARIALRPRLDAGEFLGTIASAGITAFMLPVPSHYMALLDHPSLGRTHLSSLRVIGYGGAVFPVPLLLRMIAAFPCEIFGVYGSLEGGGFASYLLPDDHRLPAAEGPERDARLRRLRSCGREGMHAELRIVDEDGQPVPAGETGEMIVRSEGAIRSYWNRPGEIEKTLRGGWVFTGDGAWMDEDRYLYMSDRLKDVVRTGGMNVSALEVENVLLDHPALTEAAVVGLPHPRWGEALVAVVVRGPAGDVSEDELLARCRAQLANYKIPKRVLFADVLPKNSMGKVVKREVRDAYAHLSESI